MATCGPALYSTCTWGDLHSLACQAHPGEGGGGGGGGGELRHVSVVPTRILVGASEDDVIM